MFDHGLGGWELLLLLLVFVLLFGAKRLPDSARALGRSLRIFKAETRGLRSDEDAPPDSTAAREASTAGEPTREAPTRAELPPPSRPRDSESALPHDLERGLPGSAPQARDVR